MSFCSGEQPVEYAFVFRVQIRKTSLPKHVIVVWRDASYHSFGFSVEQSIYFVETVDLLHFTCSEKQRGSRSPFCVVQVVCRYTSYEPDLFSAQVCSEKLKAIHTQLLYHRPILTDSIDTKNVTNVSRFGSIVDRHAGVCFTPKATEYFMHRLSGLPV
jgi:hypothetical protein